MDDDRDEDNGDFNDANLDDNYDDENKNECKNFVFVWALIKKEKHIFLVYKEIQNGAVANSYMKKGFLIQYSI
jgi:hypothetical protein